MRFFERKRDKQSEGERARALAYFLVGVCSAFLGLLAVLHLNSESLFDRFSLYEWWIVTASGVGGMIALFLSGDRMGQAGLRGFARAMAGGIWVTFVGALIGGTLSLPLYGTMFGPFIVTVTLIGAPGLAILWLCNLISVHLLMKIYQLERETIFERDEGTPAFDQPLVWTRRRFF